MTERRLRHDIHHLRAVRRLRRGARNHIRIIVARRVAEAGGYAGRGDAARGDGAGGWAGGGAAAEPGEGGIVYERTGWAGDWEVWGRRFSWCFGSLGWGLDESKKLPLLPWT